MSSRECDQLLSLGFKNVEKKNRLNMSAIGRGFSAYVFSWPFAIANLFRYAMFYVLKLRIDQNRFGQNYSDAAKDL